MSSQSLYFRLDLRQIIKIMVYSLLLVNFVLYITDDLRVASYTMRNGGSLLEWTSAFTTTIDESACFLLLLLFELETYLLSDEIQSRPGVMALVHGVRIVCYLSLTHTLYAYTIIYYDLAQVTAISGVTDLCQLLSPDISFVRNLDYTDLNAANCASLSSDTQFYYTEAGLVITDNSGLALEKNLALVDIAEASVWMQILFTIEAMVWLQDRSITRGSLVTFIKSAKFLLYTLLWGAAAYWISLGHMYFAWDEALWIVGFFAIEMNMSEWKNEIEQSAEGITSSA